MVAFEMLSSAEREELGSAFAFLGNSLLAPMNLTATVGLDPAFWAAFPVFDCAAAEDACQQLEAFALGLKEAPDAVTQVSVEYTQLFVGPPKPAAFPWESYYVASDVTSGFGEPTYQMQRLLRFYGLEVSHESNNQLADHIGIELLLLAELCAGEADASAVCAYVADHPGEWIDALRDAAQAAAPSGYVVGLLTLAAALLSLFR